MKKIILSIFDIEKEESLSVSLLMIQSLFIGVFNGTFYISSHTLFIESYGGESIPMAYLISGGVGIVLTLIYSKLQGIIKFTSLSKINLIFVALVTIGLAFSYSFIDKKIVDYAQFVLFGPLFVLSIVTFWGVANRLYNLRQGKRLFGIIDAGIIFGIIISNVAVATTPYLTGFEINYENLLYFTLACTVATVIIQFVLSSNFSLDKEKTEEEVVSEKVSGIKIMLQNKYVFTMATFAGLSMLIAFFVQYSFLLVLAKKYTNKIDFGAFLGAFTAIIMGFTLLLKTFVYSKLIKNYGLKTCLLLLPFLLGAFTLGAIGIGYGMGIEDVESSGFLFFFMLIALSKLIAQAIKEGIELPSFKLIYQTLNKKIRFIIQALVDGTINEFSALISGLCLVGLSALSFIGLVEISVVMLCIIILWIYTAFTLYSRYKESLESGLKVDSNKHSDNFITPTSNLILNRLKSEKTINPNLLISLQAIDPVLFEKEIKSIESKKYPLDIQTFLMSETFEFPDKNHLAFLTGIQKNSTSEIIKEKASDLIKEIQTTFNKVDYQKIISLSNSKNKKDRITAALMIRSNYDTNYDTVLLRLIKDPNLQVKIEVIKTCSLLGKIEFTPIIIEYLANDELYSTAYSAIKELGEGALEFLSQAYFKTNITDKSLITITELLSYINSEKADKLLLEKLFSKNRFIMNKAATGITVKKIKPKTEKETLELTNLLSEQISIVSWNYAAYHAYNTTKPEMTTTLEAIADDIEFSKEILFSLLSIIYDENSILIVKNNIESGDPDNISYAIEMLDLFIHEHIKPKLFAVLDDSLLNARVLLLEDYFPIEVFKNENIFDLVLNRDSNFISDWTKASVVFELDLENETISDSFIAQLFNPKQIIRETAYYKISLTNKELKDVIINRFPENNQFSLIKEIEKVVQNKNNLMVLSLLKLKEIIGTNSFKPMNWVTDIPHIKSEVVQPQNEVLLQKNYINYLLRDTNNNQSCNIVGNQFSGLKLNDRIVSVNKLVFNKIASQKTLTNILLSET